MNKFSSAVLIVALYACPTVSAQKVIDCNIIHKLHHGNDTLSVTYKLHMARNTGTVVMYGIFDEGNKKSVINRQVLFHYKSVDDTGYQLTSDKIISFSGETVHPESMRMHYPLFFLDGGMQLFMSIRDFSPYSLAISFVSDVLFICSKP